MKKQLKSSKVKRQELLLKIIPCQYCKTDNEFEERKDGETKVLTCWNCAKDFRIKTEKMRVK